VRSLELRLAAAADVDEAHWWYEGQRPGLGDEFLAAMSECFDSICTQPEQFPIVYRDQRRAIVRRFPYLVFFRALPESVVVFAVCHAVRDPRRWHAR
jgi:plasmid stabilization system protein ParE